MLTANQQKVFEAAHTRLQKYSWFKGVCTDNFPDDKDCSDSFDEAVNSVVFETSMWDDPNFYRSLMKSN